MARALIVHDERPVLLVIFGAGASHDCLNRDMTGLEGQPPLTDSLLDFDRNPQYRTFAADFKSSAIIRNRVRSLRDEGVQGSLEDLLEQVRSEAAADDDRLVIGLMAFRWYLQTLLGWCTERIDAAEEGDSLYLGLVDKLLGITGRNLRVAFVTFNYDLLLERAFEHAGYQFDSASAYLREDWAIFKVHGSVNFGREVFRRGPGEWVAPTPEDVIRDAPGVDDGEDVSVIGEFGRASFTDPAGRFYVIRPAISVPVVSKPGFELPREHLVVLRRWLPYVSRVVSVGWKARDLEFRSELGLVPKGVPAEIVTLTDQGAAEVQTRLAEVGLRGPFVLRPGGFRLWMTGGPFRELVRQFAT